MTNYEKDKEKIEWRRAMTMELPQNTFAWLKKECARAKKAGDKANHKLIGHIKEEYKLEWDKNFEDFILGDCLDHPQMQSHTKGITVLNTSKPFYIESLWVNYQKKYEFNPPHNHSGIYSFVIFVDIPFDLEKEYEYFGEVGGYRHNVPKRNSIYTSNFAFINTDYSGDIRCDSLNVDKSYEGKIIMFPAKQLHQVFPFYTSDGYRITVSGNLRLLV